MIASLPIHVAPSATVSSRKLRRVVHVPRRFVAEEWGGTETVVLELAKQQQRIGLDPVIVTSMALSEVQREIIGGVSVERHRHCYPFFGLSAEEKYALDKKGGNLLSLPLFQSLMRERDVRLYHAHTLKRLGGEVRTAARLRHRPFVATVHGGVFDVPTEESASMLRPIEGKVEWGKPFGALFGSRKVLEEADMVIFVDKAEASRASARLGHGRIAHLPNGVDCARFAGNNGHLFRASHGIPRGAFLIANISRIDAQKNQMLLLDSFVKFAATHPDAHLVLMGPETQPAYAMRLRERVEEARLGHRVHLLPGLRNSDSALAAAYQACDIFVLPSRHEPFGIVVLEAWSAGKPVIVSRVGGLATLVRDEHTGLFIEPEVDDAADHLAAQMSRLASNPYLRQQMGRNGLEEAATRYDWKQIGARQEEIYCLAEEHHAAANQREKRRAA